MSISRSALAALALASALAQAEPAAFDRPPLPVNIGAMLNLDIPRAQVVEAILDNAHARTVEARQQIGRPTDDTTRSVMRAAIHAIHEDAHRQLASVLTVEELAKLKELLRPPGDGSGQSSSL